MPVPQTLDQSQIEQFVRAHSNPFDLLAAVETPSLLELGAGDLSFAGEIVDRYLTPLRVQGRELIVHCVDRLKPDSRLGGPLHADADLLRRLKQPGAGLQFRFWGDQDMFALDARVPLLPRYAIVSCQAPATPTFAYEPTRLSPATIDQDLRKTKGEFHRVRFEGEEALEVQHGGRALLFPPWKFEIRGPLALLDLIARRGTMGVLGSVDSQVFWEILSQLVADDAVRPSDTILTPAVVRERFGRLYRDLTALPVGGSVRLSELTALRPALPRVLGPLNGSREHRFRYVEIRRGARFDGLPASRTARLFPHMKEEETPWMVILIPAV